MTTAASAIREEGAPIAWGDLHRLAAFRRLLRVADELIVAGRVTPADRLAARACDMAIDERSFRSALAQYAGLDDARVEREVVTLRQRVEPATAGAVDQASASGEVLGEDALRSYLQELERIEPGESLAAAALRLLKDRSRWAKERASERDYLERVYFAARALMDPRDDDRVDDLRRLLCDAIEATRARIDLDARRAWYAASPEEREAVYQLLRDARRASTMNLFRGALAVLGALEQPYPGVAGGQVDRLVMSDASAEEEVRGEIAATVGARHTEAYRDVVTRACADALRQYRLEIARGTTEIGLSVDAQGRLVQDLDGVAFPRSREMSVAPAGQVLGLGPGRPHAVVSCVAAVVTDPAGRLLLVRTRRGWELPGGRQELDETWREAVARELREEAGVVATLDAGEPQVFDGMPVDGASYQSIIVIARGHAQGDVAPVGGDAVREARWFAAAELPEDLSDIATAVIVHDWAAAAHAIAPGADAVAPGADDEPLPVTHKEGWRDGCVRDHDAGERCGDACALRSY